MASNPTVPLAERTEIHKSCKTLETLLNVFNDYCEAAGAVVSLQKKLAKALKETAGLKVTGEIAGNALNASANIFDALAEIDSKYAKMVDKEYDGISSEVKKWFKKLAKEEKAHDERISSANQRIKQAGQMYEKKSKKSARDAGDEHARYINLISSLGPEMSQEKYNHTLLVSQRHTTTTYSVAACFARVADAEWLRSCEGVRRYSPTVGILGEYRALCEGGWVGPLPQDLPDVDAIIQPETESDAPKPSTDTLSPSLQRNPESAPPSKDTQNQRAPSPAVSPPRYQSEQDFGPQSYSPQQQYTLSTAPSSFEPPRPLVDPNTGSVRSLSAFPAPPTHFPPPLRHGQPSRSPSQINFPSTPRTYDSRKLGDDLATDEGPSSRSVSNQSSPEPNFTEPKLDATAQDRIAEREAVRHPPSRSQTLDSFTQESSTTSTSSRQGDYFADNLDYSQTRQTPKAIERTDTGASSGSIVAAMRNRYSSNSGTSSPPPRDLPRLPLSVNDLASRYDDPGSPRRPTSPSATRSRPSLDSYLQTSPGHLPSVAEGSSSSPSPNSEEASRRRLRIAEQFADIDLQEKEQRLLAREREIEQRARELELERNNILNARSNTGNGPSGILSRNPPLQSQPVRPRERTLSLQQQRSNSDLSAPIISPKRSTSPYPSHLQPPGQGGSEETSEFDRNSNRSRSSAAEHPDYCSCESCTNTKYRSPAASSPTDKSPQLRPGGDKAKGWMRRLSMPIVVGNAFLDSKKNHSSQNLNKGISSLDVKKNGSTTMLRNNGVTEDGMMTGANAAGIGAGGGRRGYDSTGLANRSSTNLGMGRR